MNTKKILFPTDFSKLSDAALPLATSLAHDRNAELIILHVQEPSIVYSAGEYYYGPREPSSEQLWQMLDKVVPTDPKVPCRHQMGSGNPAQEIVRIAEQEDVGMIVMGTHGRTGWQHMLVGSVAEKVICRAKCSVLTFKQPVLESLGAEFPKALHGAQGKSILFATDFSSTGNAALLQATSLARDMGAQLIIMHVEEPLAPYGGGEVYSVHILDAHSESLKRTLENLRPDNPKGPCMHRMAIGDPANEILRVADEEHAIMIVMGTHGRTGLAHVLMGSVAEKVVRRASCPVLTFKQIQNNSD